MKTEHDFAPRRSIRSSATGFISAGLSRPHIGQFVLPVAVFGLILSFALASPYFWDDANFRNIARQGAGLAAVALGQTFVVLIAGLDLSVGATAGLVSVVAAWGAVNYTSSTGVLLALGTGAAIGLVNGLVVARLRVAPFVATLAMLSVASGLALIISGGIPISGLPRGFRTFATTDILGIPAAALVSLGLFVLGYVILRWLRTGRHFYAVGGNKEAARLAGIPVVRVQVSAYVLCSIFTAVGALILGRRTRRMLLAGLVAMYTDHDVDKYYDPSLLSNYGMRYALFTGIIVTLAVTAIIIPAIIRFTG